MPLSKIQTTSNQVIPNLGRRNLVINGAMQVAQRATSATGLGGNADSYHTMDRFKLGVEGSTSGRLTMTQDSSAPSGFANSLKLACTTADTSIGAGELMVLSQIIEGQDLQRFAKGTSDAKPFTVSFYVKGNASATYVCELFDGDNSRHVCKTFSVTTDWTRVELNFPADTTGVFGDDNGASLYLQIFLHAGSNFNSGTLPATWVSKTNANRAVGGGSFFDSTSRTFFITGIQLELGDAATPFEHRSFGEELLLCKRYFEVYSPTTSDNGSVGVVRTRTSVNHYQGLVHFHEKRTQPSMTIDFDRMHKPGVVKDTLSSISVTISGGETQSCTINVEPSNDSTISTHTFLGKSSGTGSLKIDAEL